MLCAKFGWKWPSGSGEGGPVVLNVFYLYPNYLPFEKGLTFHLNKLESPSPSSGSGEEDGRTDRRRTTCDQKSFQLRWAKMFKIESNV